MISAVNSTVSALQAYKTQLDVASNNVANINTENYKKSRVNLKEGKNGETTVLFLAKPVGGSLNGVPQHGGR